MLPRRTGGRVQKRSQLGHSSITAPGSVHAVHWRRDLGQLIGLPARTMRMSVTSRADESCPPTAVEEHLSC